MSAPTTAVASPDGATAVEPLPDRAWLIVGLLWAVGCLNYLDHVMITTMRGLLVEAIPMSAPSFQFSAFCLLGSAALLFGIRAALMRAHP